MSTINGIETIYYVRQLQGLKCPLPKELEGKHLRSFVYALLIAELDFITPDQARLVPLLLSDAPIVEGSARTLANLELKAPYYKEVWAGTDSLSAKRLIYRLNDEGFDYITKTMDYLFKTLGLEGKVSYDEEEFRKRYCSDVKSLSLTNHSIMTNTQSILAAFHAPLMMRSSFSYQRECSLAPSAPGLRTEAKGPATLVPDFCFRFSPHSDLMAMEVDLDTERIPRIIEKIEKYDRLYMYRKADPLFLFDPNGSLRIGTKDTSFESEREGDLYAIKKSRRLTDTEIGTLSFLMDTFALSSSADATLTEFFTYAAEKTDENPALQKAGWYDILRYLYKYLDGNDLLDHPVSGESRGQTRLSDLHDILSEIRSDSPKQQAVLLTSEDEPFLRRKRRGLYEGIRDYLVSRMEYSGTSGILSGMTIGASFQKNLWKNLRFVYPMINLFERDFVRFRHLGLSSSDNRIYRTAPREVKIGRVSLSLKNTLRYGDYTIAIENISEDVGGLLRMLSYLSAPSAAYKDLLLIALVDNDLMLANGQYLHKGSVIQSAFKTSSEGTIGHHLNRVLHNSVHSGTKARIDLMKGAGLVFMTYRDFERSYHMPVEPFLVVSQCDRIKTVHCQFT